MNKILAVGRIVRDPETNSTGSGIKYSRFTIAVNRTYGENETDFIPVVAWRSQADFIEKYLRKGALVSLEGRFTSSSYNNADNQRVTRYEITADRIQALETKAQNEARLAGQSSSVSATQVIEFEKENKPEDNTSDVPWEMDL